MSIFDIILLLLLFGFIYGGFFNGLIRSLGSIVGLILGAWAASYFYLPLFSRIGGWFGPFESLGKTVCFATVFIIASFIVGFLVRLVDKAYDILSFIPFLKTINKFAGAFLGLVQGILIIGLILYVMAKYFSADSFFGGLLINSKITPFFLHTVKLFLPFMSAALKNLRSII
ncbi:hypothetical protein GF382_02745 [Candidatus Falkowbacteria bacterium]|nr:hypothetical protein [Candidatus Falkowbacteria bacterium]